ncbi:MAG: cation-translocating P-type ATPase [Candidatus Delongbacteria bacterium]|nr:cation-translocating P-type ATPase [Candidatus Delongbacteria bacterium]
MKYKLIIPGLNSSQQINTLIQHLSEMEGMTCPDQSFGQIVIQTPYPVMDLYAKIQEWGFDIRDIIEIPDDYNPAVVNSFFYVPSPLYQDQSNELFRFLSVCRGIIDIHYSSVYHLLRISHNPEQVTPEQIRQMLSARHIYAIQTSLKKTDDYCSFLNKRLLISLGFLIPAIAGLFYSASWIGWLMMAVGIGYLAYPGRDRLMADLNDLRSGRFRYSLARSTAWLTGLASSTLHLFRPEFPMLMDWLIILSVLMDCLRYSINRIHFRNSPPEPLIHYPMDLICHRETESPYRDIPSGMLKENDLIRVHSGELIPADGIIQSGHASVNYEWFTLDATPIPVQSQDSVWSGGRLESGDLLICIRKPARYSLLNLINLTAYHSSSWSSSGSSPLHLVSPGRFTLAWAGLVMITILVGFYWPLGSHPSAFVRILPRLITLLMILDGTLLIEILNALLYLPIRAGISKGIILKNPFLQKRSPQNQIAALGINYLVNSHTCSIQNIFPAHLWNSNTILQIAYSLCQFSNDQKSEEIKNSARNSQIQALPIKNLEMIPAKGRKAELHIPDKPNQTIYLGNLSWYHEIGLINAELYQKGQGFERDGKEVLAVAVDQHIAGLLVFNSRISDESVNAINAMIHQGYHLALLNPDREKPELIQAILSRFRSIGSYPCDQNDENQRIVVGMPDDLADMIHHPDAYRILFSETERINTLPGDTIMLSKNRQRLTDCLRLTDTIQNIIRSSYPMYLLIVVLIGLMTALPIIPFQVPGILMLVLPIIYIRLSLRFKTDLVIFTQSQ